MPVRVFTRLLAASGAVFLAAGSTPAFGQVPPGADITTSLTTNKTQGNSAPAKTTNVQLGEDKTYTLSVVNKGPSTITALVIDATFTPPAAPYGAGIAVTPPAGCAPTGTADFPCKLTLAAPLYADTSATPVPVAVAEIVINVPVPSPLPTATADCPTATTVVHDAVSVVKAFQNDVDVTTALYPVAAPSLDKPIVPFADLAVTNLTAPGNASQGQSLDYSVAVHNYGPCDATGTFSDFVPVANFSPAIAYVSATGCNNAAPTATTDTFVDDGGCDLSAATFAVGGDLTYSTVWTVLTFPKSVTAAAVPVSADIIWDHDVINGADHSSSASVSTTIDLSGNKGCSTGGAGTLLALLPLAALRFRRRRSS